MASTNKTTHYNLSQYVGSDKPTYLVDYNTDMNNIDTGIYNAQAQATLNETSIGDLSTLDTTAKSSLVNAVNEVNTNANSNTSKIGNLSNLTTTANTDLVSAINEVDFESDTNASAIGTLANLETVVKTNLVGAVNEVNTNVGDLSTLDTSNKSDIVSAINEIKSEEKGTVLWTNQDLTQDFAPQTIPLNLTDYDVFDIIFAHDKYSTTKFNSIRTIKGDGDLFNGNVTRDAKMEMADRAFTITDSSIQFFDCYYCTLAGQNVVTANLRNIPYKIIGYDIH